MNIDLTSKTAIVTGSTEGIGLGSAIQLAKYGAKVIVNGRTQQKVEQAVRIVQQSVSGGGCVWHSSRFKYR